MTSPQLLPAPMTNRPKIGLQQPCKPSKSTNTCGFAAGYGKVYQDHARDPIHDSRVFEKGNTPNVAMMADEDEESKKSSRNPIAFPMLVLRMLDDAEDQGFDHIVSWRPHGRAFQIYDREAFAEQVMPR